MLSNAAGGRGSGEKNNRNHEVEGSRRGGGLTNESDESLHARRGGLGGAGGREGLVVYYESEKLFENENWTLQVSFCVNKNSASFLFAPRFARHAA